MASRVSFAGSILSGATISSTNNNTFPGGKIGRITLTSNSTGTTTTETILTQAVTAGTSRELDIFATVTVRTDITGGAQACIFEDGVQIQRKNNENIPPTADQSWMLMINTQPSAGSHTYTLVTGASGSAGNKVTAIANGATGSHGVIQMNIYDSGPSF